MRGRNLRRRAGPVTFVERQIAHIWAASMTCSTLLFLVEALLGLLKPDGWAARRRARAYLVAVVRRYTRV